MNDRTRSGDYVARYGVLDVSLSHSGAQFTFTRTSGGRAEVTIFNGCDKYNPSTQAVTFEDGALAVGCCGSGGDSAGAAFAISHNPNYPLPGYNVQRLVAEG